MAKWVIIDNGSVNDLFPDGYKPFGVNVAPVGSLRMLWISFQSTIGNNETYIWRSYF